jgi:hypothetical protein
MAENDVAESLEELKRRIAERESRVTELRRRREEEPAYAETEEERKETERRLDELITQTEQTIETYRRAIRRVQRGADVEVEADRGEYAKALERDAIRYMGIYAERVPAGRGKAAARGEFVEGTLQPWQRRAIEKLARGDFDDPLSFFDFRAALGIGPSSDAGRAFNNWVERLKSGVILSFDEFQEAGSVLEPSPDFLDEAAGLVYQGIPQRDPTAPTFVGPLFDPEDLEIQTALRETEFSVRRWMAEIQELGDPSRPDELDRFAGDIPQVEVDYVLNAFLRGYQAHGPDFATQRDFGNFIRSIVGGPIEFPMDKFGYQKPTEVALPITNPLVFRQLGLNLTQANKLVLAGQEVFKEVYEAFAEAGVIPSLAGTDKTPTVMDVQRNLRQALKREGLLPEETSDAFEDYITETAGKILSQSSHEWIADNIKDTTLQHEIAQSYISKESFRVKEIGLEAAIAPAPVGFEAQIENFKKVLKGWIDKQDIPIMQKAELMTPTNVTKFLDKFSESGMTDPEAFLARPGILSQVQKDISLGESATEAGRRAIFNRQAATTLDEVLGKGERPTTNTQAWLRGVYREVEEKAALATAKGEPVDMEALTEEALAAFPGEEEIEIQAEARFGAEPPMGARFTGQRGRLTDEELSEVITDPDMLRKAGFTPEEIAVGGITWKTYLDKELSKFDLSLTDKRTISYDPQGRPDAFEDVPNPQGQTVASAIRWGWLKTQRLGEIEQWEKEWDTDIQERLRGLVEEEEEGDAPSVTTERLAELRAMAVTASGAPEKPKALEEPKPIENLEETPTAGELYRATSYRLSRPTTQFTSAEQAELSAEEIRKKRQPSEAAPTVAGRTVY